MTGQVTIRGASDDLIEIGGHLREEFNPPFDSDDPSFLAFSDGTVLSVLYAKDGCWRINRHVTGSASYEKTEATGPDAEYTDLVTLTGDLKWVVFGSRIERIDPSKDV